MGQTLSCSLRGLFLVVRKCSATQGKSNCALELFVSGSRENGAYFCDSTVAHWLCSCVLCQSRGWAHTQGFSTDLGPSGAQLTGTPHPSVLARDWSLGSVQHSCLCYPSTRHVISQVFGGNMGSFIVATFYLLNVSLLSARTVFCYSMVMLHGTETKT